MGFLKMIWSEDIAFEHAERMYKFQNSIHISVTIIDIHKMTTRNRQYFFIVIFFLFFLLLFEKLYTKKTCTILYVGWDRWP